MTNAKKSRSKDVPPTQHEAMATMVTNSIATLELGRAKEPTLPIVHRKLGGHSGSRLRRLMTTTTVHLTPASQHQPHPTLFWTKSGQLSARPCFYE